MRLALAAIGPLLLGGCFMNDGVQGAAATKKSIELAAPKRVFSLGGSIPIGVRYTNRSTSTLELRDPQKTWEVQLVAGGQTVSFGKILRYAGEGRVRWSIETAETFSLAPGEQHSFQYDAGKRWPERFAPGANSLQVKDVTDDNETVLSNSITVRVEFTAETIPALLTILETEESSPDSKVFAEAWVRRFHPAYTNPAEGRAWWAQNGASAAVTAAIAKINQDAAPQ
jgi:hypothetical protein